MTPTPVHCLHGDNDTVLSAETSRCLTAKGKEVGADIQCTDVKDGSNGSPSIDEIVIAKQTK